VSANCRDRSSDPHCDDGPKRVRLVQKNNGNDGVFWTKSDAPVLPSHDS
jgi:hypothetical protein